MTTIGSSIKDRTLNADRYPGLREATGNRHTILAGMYHFSIFSIFRRSEKRYAGVSDTIVSQPAFSQRKTRPIQNDMAPQYRFWKLSFARREIMPPMTRTSTSNTISIGKWYSAINCNELELTTMKPLISSGFFVFQKSNYKQSDIVVHHIFLPYFYRETFSGFAPMSRWRSSLRVLTMVYVSRQKGK